MLNDEFLIKVAPLCRMFALQLQYTCECVAQTSATRKPRLCKSMKKCLPLRKECFSHDAISYPAEPFNIAFQEVGRKSAVTS